MLSLTPSSLWKGRCTRDDWLVEWIGEKSVGNVSTQGKSEQRIGRGKEESEMKEGKKSEKGKNDADTNRMDAVQTS